MSEWKTNKRLNHDSPDLPDDLDLKTKEKNQGNHHNPINQGSDNMSEWKTYKLGEISSDISYGYTESATQEKIGPKFLRITDIQQDFINWDSVPYCPITSENHKKYKLEIGDIVIARTGATTGATAIFKDENVDSVFASYLIRYKIKKSIANSFYIGHLLKSSLWKSYVASIIGGSAQPGANAKQFADFEFILPDLATQTAIAQILSSLDDKIELNLQMNQTLEAIAQAIFKEWFVDFKFPKMSESEFTGFENKQNKEKSGKSFNSENPDSDNGLPKGWRLGNISEIMYVQNGYAFKSTDFTDEGENGIIKIKNISNKVVDIVNMQFIPNEVARNIDKRFKVESGDLLIAMTGAEVGKVGIVPNTEKKIWLNQRVGSFKEKVKYSKWYCYLILSTKEYQNILLSSASGSAQPNISGSQIEKTEIILPTNKLIEEFGNIVNSLFEKILENYAINQSLILIRDTLLPKLMSGKIRLNQNFQD